MNNKRGYFKRTLSLMLSLLLVLGTFCFFNPFKENVEVAEAATAGSYTWRVRGTSSNDTGGWDKGILRVYGKPNNGTGNQVNIYEAKSMYINWAETDKNWSGDKTTSQFPTKLEYEYSFGGGLTWREMKATLYIDVYNYGTSKWVQVLKVECNASSSAYSAAAGTKSGTSGNLPSVASISLGSDTSALTVPDSGSVSGTTGSATIYDQYGVQWYQEPAGYKIYSNNTSTGTSNNINATGISVGTKDSNDKGTVSINSSFASWVANSGYNTARSVYIRAYRGEVYSNAVGISVTNRKVNANFYDYNTTGKAWNTLKQSTPVFYNYKTSVTGPTLTRSGWVFKGYSTDSSASDGANPITAQITGNTSWYAIYTKTLNSKWYWLDESGNSANDENRGTTLTTEGTTFTATAPDVPDTVSYGGSSDWKFVGWREDTKAEAPTEVNRTFDESATNGATKSYYAIYQRTFTLKLNGNGSGNVVTKTETQYLNASGTMRRFTYNLSNFTDSIANTTFVGWSTNSADEYTNATNEVVTLFKDTTYYAIYKVDVNFYNEGVLYNSQTITRNKNAKNPAPNTTGEDGFARPQKAFDSLHEYYYSGWDKGLNNILENTTINATYDVVDHTYEKSNITTPTCTENGKADLTCSNDRKDTGKKCLHLLEGYTENILNVTDIAKLGHSWVITPAKAPTCTTDGYTVQKQCSRCSIYDTDKYGNEIKQTVVPSLGHDIDFENDEPIEVFEHNCVADGYKIYKCKRDGCTYTEKVITEKADSTLHKSKGIPAVKVSCTTNGSTEGAICEICGAILVQPKTIICEGHKWDVVKAKEATCTEDGCTEGKKCSVCGLVISESKTIPATGHKYETVPAKNATCTEDGNTSGEVCSVCGYVPEGSTYGIVTKQGHIYNTEPKIIKAATCSETGLQRISCERCSGGEIKEEVIPKLPHTEETIPAVAATCSAYGYTEGKKCSVCDEIIVAPEKIEKLEHTWEVVEEGYPATCTTDGKTTSFKCTICGATKGGNVLNKSGHSYGTVTEIAATCKGPGKQFKRCGNCGATTVVETNPLGHDYKETAEVEATCTTDGKEAGFVCTRCKDILSGCEIIEATGHNWEEKTIKATCTTDGKVYKVCSVCGAEGETISTTPAHHTAEDVAEVKATCTRSGYTAGTKCSVCGKVLSGCERTDPAEHNVYVYQEAKDATCNTIGWTEGTKCFDCGLIIKKSTVVARLEHTYGSWETEYKATCTGGGKMVRKCTLCGADEKMTLLPKGHSYSGYATLYEPTCETTGCKQRVCKNCGDVEDVAIAAKGHVKVEVAEIPATCTADGLTAGVKCKVCDKVFEGIEKIPATGHKWVKTRSVEGDCEHDSYDVYTCDTCHATENRITKYSTGHYTETAPTCKQRCICDTCGQEYGELGEHNYEAVTTAPTCTQDGYTTYTCTYCGNSYKALPTAATGVHSYVEVGVEKEATCTEEGKKILKCKTCGETVTETIPAKGHNVTEWTVDGGNCSGTCSECGEIVTRPATDSDYTECDRCGLKHTRSTGLFKYRGLFCSIRYFFRQIAKLFTNK